MPSRSSATRSQKAQGFVLAVVVTVLLAAVVGTFWKRSYPSPGEPDGASGRTAPSPVVLESAKACPKGTAKCLGVKSGDVDGDDVPDLVGLTFDLLGDDPELNPYDEGELRIHMLLGSGLVHSEVAQAASDSGRTSFIKVGWIGLCDVNADGREEMFIANGGGEHLRWVEAYEVETVKEFAGSEPELAITPLRGIVAGTFDIDSADSVKAGFTCSTSAQGRPVMTKWRVEFDAIADRYNGEETLWEADNAGVFAFKGSQRLSYRQGEAELQLKAGANCPGLSRFPTTR